MFTSREGDRWRPLALTVDHVRAIDSELANARNAVFPIGYFANLPWQLMLDLDAAGRAGHPFPFSGEGYAMPTAMLYRLRQFEADGFVERRVDPVDANRELAVLTPMGRDMLNEVFEQAALNFKKAA
jgi:hypothetical protein